MSKTLGQGIDKVLKRGGFDATSANVDRGVCADWINTKYREMVRRSEWRVEPVTIATTTAGQADYGPLDTQIIRVKDPVVVGGTPFRRVGTRQLSALAYGDVRVLTKGVYGPGYSVDGRMLSLYPPPDTGGAAIVANCVLYPTVLADENADALILDDEFADAVFDGAIGLGMEEIYESPSRAQAFYNRFDTKTEELRRLANRMLEGGPRQLNPTV